MIFSFGGLEKERLAIDAEGYERTPVGETYDDNWLRVEVRVAIGGFTGKAKCAIQTSELASFADELKGLFETLKGTAKFETLEDQLGLTLTGDGRGHIDLKGHLVDQAGIGNQLNFKLTLDQSDLGNSLRELESVVSTYPFRQAG